MLSPCQRFLISNEVAVPHQCPTQQEIERCLKIIHIIKSKQHLLRIKHAFLICSQADILNTYQPFCSAVGLSSMYTSAGKINLALEGNSAAKSQDGFLSKKKMSCALNLVRTPAKRS